MNSENNRIQFVARKDIDEGRWNARVESAANGLIYANTNMLDAFSPGWSALLTSDYKVVMPLTSRKKFGFTYLYQPPFAASLGIIGDLSDKTINEFLFAIPSLFKLVDIQLNETNLSDQLSPNFAFRKRRNLLLKLDDYSQVASGYKRLANRMLAKAKELKIEIKDEVPAEDIIEFYRRHYSGSHQEIKSPDYLGLLNACNNPFGKMHTVTYQASSGGKILASYLLFKDEKFVYSILGGSIKEGKESGAFYLLTDRAIRDNCGQNKIFRFEGSDDEGIAFFDSQFGPAEINYPHLIINRLPWPLRWFKLAK
ncbi:MAG: hypothetical protein C5B52_04280 [Bacteroidetes bacterium]|nr:MAG: hypothetical protein C5B52_04280 [Bacteroidota bacterium]